MIPQHKVVAAILINAGREHRMGRGCSVQVGIKLMTDAIPNTIGITFFTMVVFAIYKATLEGYGFF